MASLYRKWRSRSFDDLYGQEHVVKTLLHAVQQRRVAHAYLFTGPRGTGKTSAARILAKAVNCLDPQGGNPCNRCTACVAADDGRAMDVIEIDAASNTSVEHVRELRERVAYAAGEGQYKVYIVDEVHRLSGAAFDAFLKTLEEPPPHVIFVFASTEPHKVPETIASRCQRFDFRRIGPAVTLQRLRFVAEQERIDVAEEGLRLIAQHAHGSLRDALGLLDQVSAYGEGRISEADVRSALGLADAAIIGQLTDALIGRDLAMGLGEIQKFVDMGGDPAQLARQFAEYIRSLLLCKSSVNTNNAGIDPVLSGVISAHVAAVTEAQLVRILHAILGDGFSAKFNILPQLPFELGFVEAVLGLGTEEPAGQLKKAGRAQSTSGDQSANGTNIAAASSVKQPSGLGGTDGSRSNSPAETPSNPPVPSPKSANQDADALWPAIVNNMGVRNKSLQAVLRSSFVMGLTDGELTIGFPFDFHCKMFADVQKRRVLEEVATECVGTPVRVKCVKVTKDEIRTLKGSEAVLEDDGFIDEVAERLREFHTRQLGNGHS